MRRQPRAIGAFGLALALGGLLALSGRADALDGRAAFATIRFGAVGTVSASGSRGASGFSATQIAPSWVVTAAHTVPTAGSVFFNDFGASAIVEVVFLSTRAPTDSPLPGVLRDDLALVRLATPIRAPYLPRLADDGAFLPRALRGLPLTPVSNNPDPMHRRYGAAELAAVFERVGYELLVSSGKQLSVVGGDSGSALFLGRLRDLDGASVLLGVASSQITTSQGANFGVYTRVGAYREMLDAAVKASGEELEWTPLR